MTAVVLIAAFLLAFVNGANDNMKGVATLYGSGTLSYRSALAWATLSTALGSLASILLAAGLAKSFSGKGLVPQNALTLEFLTAVAVAAAITVLAATWLGFPVSTTHAIVGGLAGAGLVAAGKDLNLAALGMTFLVPLLVSPVVSMLLAWTGYTAAKQAGTAAGLKAESCVCVGEEWVPVGSPAAPAAALRLNVSVGTNESCERRYFGRLVGVSVQSLVDTTHLASAGLVGFARGLNDTPKIVGLVVAASALSPVSGVVAITACMAIGGLLARRVAETLSKKITPMTPAQGLSGNLATSLLVAAASRFGLPVSTTHVSTGAIVGVGAAGGSVRWKTVASILGAWVTTLPLAAALGAAGMLLLNRI